MTGSINMVSYKNNKSKWKKKYQHIYQKYLNIKNGNSNTYYEDYDTSSNFYEYEDTTSTKTIHVPLYYEERLFFQFDKFERRILKRVFNIVIC